ncbi:hypothetical protein [Cyanobacterium sp. uoEpiScrs1]|nr:hypothetical protein [Cyanobacterium sp. uoEpiScrs1]
MLQEQVAHDILKTLSIIGPLVFCRLTGLGRDMTLPVIVHCRIILL